MPAAGPSPAPAAAPGHADAPGSSIGRRAPHDPAAARRAWGAAACVLAGVAGVGAWPRSMPLPPSWAVLVAASLLAGAAVAGRARPRRRGPAWAHLVPAGLAAALLAAGVATARLRERPTGRLDALLAQAAPTPAPRGSLPGPIVRLELVATSRATVWRPPAGALDRFLPSEPSGGLNAAVRAVWIDGPSPGRWRPTHGTVRLVLPPDAARSLQPGDRVRATGVLRPIEPPRNPGERDARPYAMQEGRAGTFVVGSADLLEPLPRAPGPRGVLDAARRAVHGVREAVRRPLRAGPDAAAPPSDARALLLALVLGEREAGFDEIEQTFAATGGAHILAVSGFHLVVLVGGAVWLVRLTGDRPRCEAAVLLALPAVYLALVPANVPVVRAGVLVLALAVGTCFRRRYDRLALLAWAAAGLALARPADVAGLGAQLSVGITALLLWLGGARPAWVFGTPPALPDRLTRPGPLRVLLRVATRGMREALALSLCCWAVATPVVAMHTGRVSLVGPLAAALLTPVASGAMALGFLAGGLGALAAALESVAAWALPALAAPLASPLHAAAAGVADAGAALAALLLAGARTAEALPAASLELPRLDPLWGLAALVAVLTALGVQRLPRVLRWLLAAAGAALLAAGAMLAQRLAPGVLLRVDMLAVGDGTCAIIRSGGDTLLWDCGSLAPGSGRVTLPRAARALGVGRARLALLTHDNIDHFAGLPEAHDALGFPTLLVASPALDRLRAAAAGVAPALLAGLHDRGVSTRPVSAGERLALGHADVRFLSPQPGAPARLLAANDSSAAAAFRVRTAAGDRTLLLCGDLQQAGLAALSAAERATEPGLRAHAVEAPHHGAATPAAADFLARVGPAVVLQSTGPRRAGDPRWAPLQRALHAAGGGWLTTASDGAAWVEFLADGTVRGGSFRGPRRVLLSPQTPPASAPGGAAPDRSSPATARAG